MPQIEVYEHRLGSFYTVFEQEMMLNVFINVSSHFYKSQNFNLETTCVAYLTDN